MNELVTQDQAATTTARGNETLFPYTLEERFDIPTYVLDGVQLVMRRKSSDMTVANYSFVQYGSGHRITVYMDLLWEEGVQPWLIAKSAITDQLHQAITDLLTPAGYSKIDLNTFYHDYGILRRAERAEENIEAVVTRFFDLIHAAYDEWGVVGGTVSRDVLVRDGMPYADVALSRGYVSIDGTTALVSLKHWPAVREYIGKSFYHFDDIMASEGMAVTRPGGKSSTRYDFTWPEAYTLSHQTELQDNKLLMFANLPGFTTLATGNYLLKFEPTEWVQIKFAREVISKGDYPATFGLSNQFLQDAFEKEKKTMYVAIPTSEFAMPASIHWYKPANSVEWLPDLTVYDNVKAPRVPPPTDQPRRNWFQRFLFRWGLTRDE